MSSTPPPAPSTPAPTPRPAFEMVGDPGAEACVDGVCAVPAPARRPEAQDTPTALSASRRSG